jgi:LuxR family maltose regulon positive regulatory protein
MFTTILATKLYIPPPRPKIVARRHLIDRLNEGLSAGRTPGMTLIAAPAGFGKTTLLSEWVAVIRRRWPGFRWMKRMVTPPAF